MSVRWFAEASGHRLVVQVLRVLGLGEEQPAFGQQAGGLHLASRNTCASRERVAHCNSTQRLWWNPAGHRLAQRDF